MVEVLGGVLKVGQPVHSAATGKTFQTGQMFMMRPLGPSPLESLGPGQVGCVSLGMKSITEVSTCMCMTMSSCHMSSMSASMRTCMCARMAHAFAPRKRATPFLRSFLRRSPQKHVLAHAHHGWCFGGGMSLHAHPTLAHVTADASRGVHASRGEQCTFAMACSCLALTTCALALSPRHRPIKGVRWGHALLPVAPSAAFCGLPTAAADGLRWNLPDSHRRLGFRGAAVRDEQVLAPGRLGHCRE